MRVEDSLVAIAADQDSQPVGAGVLLSGTLIVTCAHVVNDALERGTNNPERPSRGCYAGIHADRASRLAIDLDPHPLAWSPPPASREIGADLCFLRLKKSIDRRSTQINLEEDLIGQNFRTCGYPSDFQGDLDIAIGQIVGKEADGLLMLRPHTGYTPQPPPGITRRILGERDRPTGLIYAGFSGAPVEVDNKIAGLIVEVRANVAQFTAYMIPFAKLITPLLADIEIRDAEHETLTNREFLRGLRSRRAVEETYLISTPLVESFAETANRTWDAELILANANRLRVEAEEQRGSPATQTIRRHMLPNIDMGAVPFWHECLLRASLMGPRMLAAILLSYPGKTGGSAADADRTALLNLISNEYSNEDVHQ